MHHYKEQMIIGTLGPRGSYSEKAALQWDDNADLRYYDDIFDTVDALLRHEVDSALYP
jgi:prephenate dehydratase